MVVKPSHSEVALVKTLLLVVLCAAAGLRDHSRKRRVPHSRSGHDGARRLIGRGQGARGRLLGAGAVEMLSSATPWRTRRTSRR